MVGRNTVRHSSLEGQAALYALGCLEPGEAHVYEVHLTGCVRCRGAVDGFRNVVTHLGLSAPLLYPSPDSKARLFARLRQGRRSDRPDDA